MRLPAILFCALLLIGLARADDRLDLNSATLPQLRTLPLTEVQVQAIWDRLLYEGPFENLYDVGELPEIDAKTLSALRDLVRVNPPRPADQRLQKIEDAYYRIETLGTEEGTNVGLVDEWIDRLLEPMNVNDATLDELMDLQNVSPADAVAIYNQVQRQGAIRGSRDLRAVPGLSDWGYRNARNYLGYEQAQATGKLHGSYTFREYNTPFFLDEELAIDPTVLVDPRPDFSHKLRVTYDHDYKAGILWHRNLGEPTVLKNDGSFQIPEMKWFGGIEKQKLGGFRLDRAYVGNYQVSLGQGVVMESGDYFSPRYSGFGFDKRITGVAPDLSRSQEFTLRGAAAEGTFGKFKGIGFLSAQKKDAILNPDGSLNRLIELVPRTNIDIYPTAQKLANGDTVFVPAFEGTQSMLDAVNEVGLGGEFAFRPVPGSSVGLIATQFMYDRPLKPDFGQAYSFAAKTRTGKDTVVEIYPVIDPQERDEILDNDVNPEITQAYSSQDSSRLWGGAKSVRQVLGLNLATVVNNYSFQFEYGELQKQYTPFKIGDDPHAMVASAHAQWNALTLLAVYRDYDIGYDNPYSRGFANYARYNGTTYQDEFYLANPIFAQLQRNAPVPQAERGIFFAPRYQVSRPLVLEGEIDNWTRVPDQADYYRWVGKITYRPVWPVLVRVRQKLQGRWNHEPAKETGFTSYENRIVLEYRLSRFDNLSFLYASGYTRFTPRPRLVGDVDPTGESPIDAQVALPSEAAGIQMTHYFSPQLKVRAAWLYHDGFFWNFEDTDFQVLDGRSSRWWFSISDRLTDALAVHFKLTGDSGSPLTWIQSRDTNAYPVPLPGYEYTATSVQQDRISFRIQVDYLF